MGCCYSKDLNNRIPGLNKGAPVCAHTVPLFSSSPRYIEFKDDIDGIRRAAKNICLLSDNYWYIDTIKNKWDIIVIDSNLTDCTGTSVTDSQKYLNIRFQQALLLSEKIHKIPFPETKEPKILQYIEDEEREIDPKIHSFKLALIIAYDTHNHKILSHASLFVVAAEQKGTEAKLLSAHAMINIQEFRKSIGLPSISNKLDDNIDEYDLSYGLDSESLN
jgi:hypothetical protein